MSSALSVLLLVLSSAPSTVRVSGGVANIHAEPSGRSTLIGFAHQGSELQVKDCVPDCQTPGWYLLSPRGAVRASAVSPHATADEFPPEPEDYVYALVKAEVPVHLAPSGSAPRVGTLKPRRRVATTVALGVDPAAPEGWYRHATGWVQLEGLRLDRPSAFEGELDPELPMAFLPRAVRIGTRQNRVVLHKQGRFGGVEVGPKKVGAGGWTLSRDQVRVAFGRRRPPGVKEGERWIHVDLSEQVLTAYEGDRVSFATLVSTGKRGHETAAGHWRIWMKTRHDRMHGEDYDLEEVPSAQYFHEDQALHGAFWHDGFGNRLTHGCVNLSLADAGWLFAWTWPDLPGGWHSTSAAGGVPSTTVLVEERIAPEDRLSGGPPRSASYTR